MDGIYTNRLEETALSRASRYGSSIFKRERGAAPNHRAGRRGVKYRGRAGSAALDSAMGTELSRRSR